MDKTTVSTMEEVAAHSVVMMRIVMEDFFQAMKEMEGPLGAMNETTEDRVDPLEEIMENRVAPSVVIVEDRVAPLGVMMKVRVAPLGVMTVGRAGPLEAMAIAEVPLAV